MVNRAIKNRLKIEKCSHLIKDYRLDNRKWKKLIELSNVLKPCYMLTNKLSSSDILPTDAYISWYKTRNEINKMKDMVLSSMIIAVTYIVLVVVINLPITHFRPLSCHSARQWDEVEGRSMLRNRVIQSTEILGSQAQTSP